MSPLPSLANSAGSRMTRTGPMAVPPLAGVPETSAPVPLFAGGKIRLGAISGTPESSSRLADLARTQPVRVRRSNVGGQERLPDGRTVRGTFLPRSNEAQIRHLHREVVGVGSNHETFRHRISYSYQFARSKGNGPLRGPEVGHPRDHEAPLLDPGDSDG